MPASEDMGESYDQETGIENFNFPENSNKSIKKSNISPETSNNSSEKSNSSFEKSQNSSEKSKNSSEESNGSFEKSNHSSEKFNNSSGKSKHSSEKSNNSSEKSKHSSEKSNNSSGMSNILPEDSNKKSNNSCEKSNKESNNSTEKANNSPEKSNNYPEKSNSSLEKRILKSAENGATSSFREEEFTEALRSLPLRREHEKFIKESVDLILNEAVFEGTSRKNKVVEWMEPSTLKSLINLKICDESLTHEDLINLAKNVIKYSVKTGHPHFVNQLFSGVDPYGLVGQWLTDALNPSIYTYEVSPVLILMEEEVLKEMRRIVGWVDGKGDGIFSPGGSMANGMAINLARHYRFPRIKETGLFQLPRLVIFTSEDSHYSVKKLAAFMGLGTDNVISVKVDGRGKMCMKDLEKQVENIVEEGGIPLMVSSTAGTTVLGAFDPLLEISKICEKYRMWFHIDAAWGGGALMSRKHRQLLEGAELADSITWNPHKMLTAPQQCSTLLLKHENLLQSAHGSKATYLFQKDKFYDTSYDVGDKYIQCGRRADVLKFWFMWKAKGSQGFEKHVDRVFELSRYFTEMIRNRSGWKLLMEPECTNVCFRYVPVSKRHLEGEELMKELHKMAPIVKERMVKKGSMLITYQPLREERNFFRLVLQNSALTEADIRFFIEEIERLSSDL